ncbi:hypothetical protein NM688_g6977 [Phlebia brevispora]|uniref:Uncharacterized protein n=1 Tax=Phlebia brevispora TaxID=194682 RepID=A0ACC1SAD0_9APHY|nr:hypothetical protein NM688_g6977 [Phlebia brevispora]
MPPKRKRAEQATTATTRTRTSTRKMTPASTEGDASGSAEPIAEVRRRYYVFVHDVYLPLDPSSSPLPQRSATSVLLRTRRNLAFSFRCVAGSSVLVAGVALYWLVASATPLPRASSLKLMKLTSLFFCCSSHAQPYSDEPSPSLAKASNEISASASSANDTVKAKPAKSSRPTEADPFSPERATELFNKYTEPDDTSVIGVDGFLKLCNDAGIAMDGPLPILLHWQLNAEDMMKIKKSEWDEGMAGLQIASLPTLSIALHDLEDLLILDHPPVEAPSRGLSHPEEEERRVVYKRVRNIEMDTATAFWSVLLLPRYPLMQDILDFINEKKDTYKGVNKDLWLMVLEFCRTISPTLQDYDTDGAWPTMLDDFVTWKRSQVSGNGKAFVQA